MFTGLVEELGTIKTLNNEQGNLHIEVEASEVLTDVVLGDSIALDGCCQTVTKFDNQSFWVTAIEETLNLTNFRNYKVGTKVNLERCLKPSDRLGGHIVQGHVDGVATLAKIDELDGSWEVFIDLPENLVKYVIHKGSIAISGISLTVASIEGSRVSVCIIPKTWEVTSLSQLQVGDKINIEVDLIAKYVEKLVAVN